MLQRTLSKSFKHHPVQSTMYAVYIGFWLFLCYLKYYYFVLGDGETIQAIVFYWFMVVCIPYLTVNIILSYQIQKQNRFYKRMATLIFIPMGLVLLVLVQHAIIEYYNMGV
ncbi:hypothetical protein BDD43_1889 [Mucilaginibacter gracilis]|uniref:Uncharacterized protein n=1 Tax=Mucilaginibacter gracilis TaxID=423350 RepID=A0A495J057_9SPHI|nr:hypothetical protein [Mucilaginibacter gracilis]RKR81738.1 hypothetical protein BDD43_1889 [Mucilaginibacter gracilis]